VNIAVNSAWNGSIY